MTQDIIHNKLIQYKSLFWSPDYLDPSSAWIEHIPFAFWFMEVLRPNSVVELGVHGGSSYFSFCQAIKSININTVCYGIDTWQGDEHAGFYNEEVFQNVNTHNAKEFSRFSTLIKSTFDEAREYFVDGSIDVLHIDGLHTYEIVKHDFEAWLPKISPNGYVIFHDINVRERNFGVFKFWEELTQKYTHFKFDFGHGLGIIALGKIVQEELNELANENESYYAFMRNFFSERGNFFKVKSWNEYVLGEQRNQLAGQISANTQLNDHIKALESRISELSGHNKSIESQITLLNEEREKLKLQNTQLIESSKDIEASKNHFKVTLEAVELTNNQLSTNNKELTDVNKALIQEKFNLESASNLLHASYKELGEANKVLSEQNSVLDQLQKKYFDETTLHIKKIEELETIVKNISEKLSATEKENGLFKKYINWYKSTYEDRSIWGVLKEKIRRKITKAGSFSKDEV
ncbi:MAG: class I SAM-dependent methyltransferase [Bacteroidota bacterium]